MSEVERKHPYSHLGQHLKALRARAKESLAEAAGAVEVDVMELASIEKGLIKPAEDILLLLISHFGAKENEAVHLWEMAGYTAIKSQTKENDAILAEVLYTDSVQVTATKNGVVMNFMITGEDDSKSLTKFGMSREHAQKIAEAINETLKKTDQ